ncbi:uncharacterized protein LOC116210485 [Punica granatum]|uniref:Late embryogenesis abundant protein LEA-2 subgroup domain-containing protein n=2 Tax=Punica granatum TaxID=22663 RepID=A0A218W766_PUNGR|nr:uncharacterized protein LOC116210485 [Punica granatum]OWM68704.1 hypothetical protein CDL15_Pgr024891 [Punica granatum]PKI58453.1 hypothetical protein CRG98_021138 [Punica granatum]
MADLEASAPHTGRQPKSPRQVAFSEIPLPPQYQHHQRDDQRKKKDHQDESGRPCCFTCCAGACLCVLAFLLVIVVLGVSFLSFLQSELPDIRVQSFSFSKLGVRHFDSESYSLLNATANVFLNMTNKNDKVGISYHSLLAYVSSNNIQLGQNIQLDGFSQSPRNSTSLKVTATLLGAKVDTDDAQMLESDAKSRKMSVDVGLHGSLGFYAGDILKLQGLPFQIRCSNVLQSQIDVEQPTRCNIRLFAS